MKWFKGKTAPPYMLQIWPTLKCNLNCIYCWRRLRDKIPEEKISPERYVEIIKEAGSIGIKRVEIAGGGEPLVFKKIFELTKLVKSSGMLGTMTSNGTLIAIAVMISKTVRTSLGSGSAEHIAHRNIL